MTGTIWSIGTSSGFIQSESSCNVFFDFSAVLTYDLAMLTVGRVVTFELRSGNDSRAVNVVVQKQPHTSRSESSLRYMGFEQSGPTRIYRIEEVVLGAETKRFTVTADMELFTRHHIGLQEGPALCLRSVAEKLQVSGAAQRSDLRCSLSDQNMLAYLERQPVRTKSGRPKRTLACSLNTE